MIYPYAGSIAPRNWTFCDGRLLSAKTYYMLFGLIGNTYGGDGKTSFALPNLPPADGTRSQYIICHSGLYPARTY